MKQSSLSNPNARIMRKNRRAGFPQRYNAHAAVDADGRLLTVGRYVSQSASDYAELENGVASIPPELGKPESVLAEAGYVNGDAFDRLEEKGVEIYCSVHREDAHNERDYHFRPETASGSAVREPTDKRLVEMRDKQRSDEGKALFKRSATAQPNRSLGSLRRRWAFAGLACAVKKKWRANGPVVSLAYNLKRLHGLANGPKTGVSRPKPPAIGPNDMRTLPLGISHRRIYCAISPRFHRLIASFTSELVLTPTGS